MFSITRQACILCGLEYSEPQKEELYIHDLQRRAGRGLCDCGCSCKHYEVG